jgi:transposase
MDDLTRLSEENNKRILDIVEALQPATAQQVQEELERRHGVRASLEQVTRYMEFLRSNFPRKLAHAGPELWIVVDLG